MQLKKLSDFRDIYFDNESAPDTRTLRKMIDDDKLPGRRIGKQYYVDVHRFEAGDDALALSVLEAN